MHDAGCGEDVHFTIPLQSDGLEELVMQIIKLYAYKTFKPAQTNWEKHLLYAMMTYFDLKEDTTGSADAYVVVYSVTERETFEIAVDILFGLRERGYTSTKAVILIGNKSDLVRSRTVSIVEGKSVAISYESKFMETSAVISHKTDDLLVGIVSQIRLKNQQKKDFNQFSPPGRGHKYRSKGSLYGPSRRARDMLNKFLGKERYKSKSCDNLHVL
ncbi:GTP-binding protein RAD-like [Limulus polyphemus]|uniref:GTP-binding protein RAD-like n=1 Tax=Limulus polyphemus TaxID=6850 RepID=A0ABM1S1C1_LIMPO|nr:GTP-binding protein RAD-like [Limulus polyphemus]